VSLYIYNTTAEIDRLVATIKKIKDYFQNGFT